MFAPLLDMILSGSVSCGAADHVTEDFISLLPMSLNETEFYKQPTVSSLCDSEVWHWLEATVSK